jgi:hypothetical protein
MRIVEGWWNSAPFGKIHIGNGFETMFQKRRWVSKANS